MPEINTSNVVGILKLNFQSRPSFQEAATRGFP